MSRGLTRACLLLAMVILAEATGKPRVDAGDLYVANLRSSEITVYDGHTGAFKQVFIEAGAAGVAGPTGIAFGPDGHLYVANSQTNQILRYDGYTGDPLGPFIEDTALAMPFSLTFGPDGQLYVSSGRGNVVRRYDGHSGAFLNLAAADNALRQPIGLAFGPDRMLYVVNSVGKSVMRFDPNTGRGLVVVPEIGGFPSDVVFGPDNALYVSNASQRVVARYDYRSGAFRDTYALLPDGTAPVGLAFTADGRLFVGDFGGDRLFVVPPGGGPAHLVSADRLAGPENMVIKSQ